MKTDTWSLWLTGVGLVGGAMCIQYTSTLSQWANSGQTPGPLNWQVIVVSTIGVGFTNLVSFCSGKYSKWQDTRNATQNTKQPSS